MSSLDAAPSHSNRLPVRWVIGLSWANLAMLMVVSGLLFAVSETWWFSSAMTYMPRIPYLLPTAALLLASLRWHRGSIPVNLISAAMILGPIMGLTLPIEKWVGGSSSAAGSRTLKIVSCNVQGFSPDFASIIAEISRLNPDVVAFQDARGKSKLFEAYFAEWQSVQSGEFFVASKYPIKLLATGHFEAFRRNAVIQCEIDTPAGSVLLFNLHQMTPRQGLRSLDLSSPITSRGSEQLSFYLQRRAQEAADVRGFVETACDGRPALIVGDFNMPCESSLYQQHWFGFQNAFNAAGVGYGYTFPCTPQYCWPGGFPWMRLDHILTDGSWRVQRCQVGTSNGSDHHLISASLTLP